MMSKEQIDFTKPVRTVNGNEVRIYATDGGRAPIHGSFKIDCGWVACGWTKDGEHRFGTYNVPKYNLENVPEKVVGYINMYPNGRVFSALKTREMADRASAKDRTACIRVEYEEGQYDD